MLKIVIRNAASNWLGYAVNAVVGFFLTPFVLATLGDAGYGIWALVIGLTGYYGLLDLGLRAGITQTMTLDLARKDYAALNRNASTALLVMSLCGAGILVASLPAAWVAPRLFKIPEELVVTTRACMLIVGLSVALQFVAFPFSAAFAAAQRYDVSNLIGVSTRLLTAAASVAVLGAGLGLVGLAAATAAVNILDYAIRWRVAHRIIPELAASFRTANRASVRVLGAYSGWNVLIAASQQLVYYSGAMIIGIFMPVAAVAPFQLAGGVVQQLLGLIAPLVVVLFPAFAHLNLRDDQKAFRSVFLSVSRWLSLVALTAGVVSFLWADDFFHLWLGADYGKISDYPAVALLYRILLVGAVATAGARAANQVLLALNRMGTITAISASEAAACLLACVVLVPWWGLIGAALALTVPPIVVRCVIQPAIVTRIAHFRLGEYVFHTFLRPTLFGMLLTGLLLACRAVLPPADTWTRLVCAGLVGGAIALPVGLLVGIEGHEQARFRRLLIGWRRPVISLPRGANVPEQRE